MKNFKFYFSFICMMFVLLPLHAKKVELEKAESVAQHYVQSRNKLRATNDVRLKYIATNRQKQGGSLRSQDASVQDTVYYYVFNVNEDTGGGFVIVSGDDAVKPVLGYSDNGSYDENNLPPNFAWWMDGIQQQIMYAQTKNLPQSKAIGDEWNSYLNGNISFSTSSAGPLIQTQWNQRAPYNNLCPTIGGTPTLTGCVATAMAQIMNYYKFPASGSGKSEVYTTPSGINMPSESFEVNYDWANMLNTYTGSETPQQQNAVATLMYHCGASVKMQYDLSESSSINEYVINALTNNFGYDRNMQIRYRNDNGAVFAGYTDTEWENMLREQIDAGLPIYYAGKGSDNHAFVCDGYDNAGKFHFNWGWSGLYDGYFVTSALNPGSYDFTTNQLIITDIKPVQGYLKGLNISIGTLSPAFRPYIFDYTVQVDSSVTSIDIAGICDIPGATVAGNTTALPLKLNDFTDTTITVTLSNNDKQQYRVSVIRGNLPPVSFTWTIDNAEQVTQFEIGSIVGEQCIINWGDGTKQDTIISQGYTVVMTHIYSVPGPYQVTILGENSMLPPPLLSIKEGNPDPSAENNYRITALNIQKATDLLSLVIYRSDIEYLDVTHNSALTMLFSESKLTNLDVSHNIALVYLIVGGGTDHLTNLDVSHNPQLLYLWIDRNRLTNLDISHNPQLYWLGCGGNKLTNLDASKNISLNILTCDGNQLSNLDVTHNPALTHLECQLNQLTELNISHNPALNFLYCDINKLTNLDIRNNPLLTNLGCSSNKLTKLDVSHNQALNFLNCYDNSIPLANLYVLAQRNIPEKYLNWQHLPDSTVLVNTSIAIDTIFYGVNTIFVINWPSPSTNYTLSNGEITFLTPGDYQVQISNPAIIDSNGNASVYQTFHVIDNTGISNLPKTKTLNAWVQDGALHVSGLTAGKSWSVYNDVGTIVYQGVAAGDVETLRATSLPHGAYIIQSGKETVKIVY